MSSRFSRRLVLAAILTVGAATAHAQGFSAGISPSKFELAADPGDVLRDTITIVNTSADASDYLFKTADWQLSDTGRVEFVEDALVDGSCRPWVRLERRTLRVDAGAQRNYRFEVHVPADAPAGLCRFAIIMEPPAPVVTQVRSGNASIAMPVVGRYAIVTYVTVGDAAADIEFLGVSSVDMNGQRYPAATLRNVGNSFDRAVGQLVAVDFGGERVELVPTSFPVLPGRTEQIAIIPDLGPEATGPVVLRFPLRVTGRIEIGRQTFEIDEVLE